MSPKDKEKMAKALKPVVEQVFEELDKLKTAFGFNYFLKHEKIAPIIKEFRKTTSFPHAILFTIYSKKVRALKNSGIVEKGAKGLFEWKKKKQKEQ